jgi:hypothetical protein
MGALSKKLRNLEGGLLSFWCPGCDEPHSIKVHDLSADDKTHPIWGWNGNVDAPTFTPSILVRSGHYASPDDICWCTYNAEHPDDPTPFVCHQCHSFVTDGKIQFLADSTHKLSGQTVEIPDWDD